MIAVNDALYSKNFLSDASEEAPLLTAETGELAEVRASSKLEIRRSKILQDRARQSQSLARKLLEQSEELRQVALSLPRHRPAFDRNSTMTHLCRAPANDIPVNVPNVCGASGNLFMRTSNIVSDNAISGRVAGCPTSEGSHVNDRAADDDSEPNVSAASG